ncbi:MAG: serine/threonine-protein kinase [Planctomycetota bacterium]
MTSRDDHDRFPEIPGFAIQGVLGRGSMATVYRAVQLDMDRPVALKVLRADLFRDDRARERILREARLAARCNHPNVVRVLYAGVHEGRGWLAMDAVEGRTLKEILAAEGRLDEARVLDIARQIATALLRFEADGLVHRDIKPGNVMIDREGRVLLLDFGLATVTWDARYRTKSRAIGTPAYMAPEQATDPDAVSIRSDFFSLGATLYHLATGTSAFEAPRVAEVITKILYHAPPPARELVPELSEGFETLVARLLAKDPDDRPANVAELLATLAALSGETPVEAPRPGAGRRRRTAALAAIAAVVLGLTAGAIHLARDRSGEVGPVVEEPPPLAVRPLANLYRDEGDEAGAAEIDRREAAARELVFARAEGLAGYGAFDEAAAALDEGVHAAWARALGVPWAEIPERRRQAFDRARLDRLAAIATRRETLREERVAEVVASLEERGDALCRATPAPTDAEIAASLEEILVRSGLEDSASRGALAAARDDVATAVREERDGRLDERLDDIEGLADARAFRRALAALEDLEPRLARGGEASRSRGQKLRAQITAADAAARAAILEVRNTLRSIEGLRAPGLSFVADPFDAPHPSRIPRPPRPEYSRTFLAKALSSLPDRAEDLVDGVEDGTGSTLESLRALARVLALAAAWEQDLGARLAALPVGPIGTLRLADRRVVRDAVVGPPEEPGRPARGRRGTRRAADSELLAPSEWYERLALEAPTPARPHELLARAWLAFTTGDPGGALDLLDRARSLDPPHPAAPFIEEIVAHSLVFDERVRDEAGRERLRRRFELEDAARRDDDVRFRALLAGIDLAALEAEKPNGAALAEAYRRRDRAAGLRLGLAARFGESASIEILDLAARRVHLRPRLEAGGLVKAPAGHRFEAEGLVRREAGSIRPDELVPIAFDPGFDAEADLDLGFTFRPEGEGEAAPRWLSISLGEGRVLLLSRLLHRGDHLAEAWHGLERDWSEMREYGQAVAWRGELVGYRAAVAAAQSSPPELVLATGREYRVELRRREAGRALELLVDGRSLVRRVFERPLAPGPLEIRFPMPGRIGDLDVTGRLGQDPGDGR